MNERHEEEEPPPFAASWSVLYALVIGVLVIAIFVFGWITRRFA